MSSNPTAFKFKISYFMEMHLKTFKLVMFYM